MDFKQIEAFYYVIKLKSFSKAAEALYLTQPTISAHINSIEKELDTTLVIRSTKEVAPSKTGQIFYEYAQDLLHLRDRAVFAVHHFPQDISGNIGIAASSVPAQYVLPALITKFREEYPFVGFSVSQSDSTEVLTKLIQKEAEIGFTGTPGEDPKFVFESFMHDRLVLVTPVAERFRELANGKRDITSIREETFLFREAGSGTRRESEAFLYNIGIDPKRLKVAAYAASTEMILNCVSSGMGISIVSELAAREHSANGKLLVVPVENSFLNRDLHLVYAKERQLSPVAETFLKFVKTRGQNL